jgi:hypothetical protein
MTSLKAQDANEIALAMAKALGEDIFKLASFEKEAGPEFEAEYSSLEKQYGATGERGEHEGGILKVIASAQPGSKEAVETFNMYFGGGGGDSYLTPELEQNTRFGANWSAAHDALQNALHAMATGAPAEDAADEQMVQNAECNKCPCGKKECACPKCKEQESYIDDRTAVAVDFAMTHLVRVADALDNKGFAGVASMVDDTIQKLAAKKSKKESKEDKKSKKESKEDKKSKKESKEDKKSKKESKEDKKSKKESKKE